MIKNLKGRAKEKTKREEWKKRNRNKGERKRGKKGLMEGFFIMERAYPKKETKKPGNFN
jgi:hypothetical protein